MRIILLLIFLASCKKDNPEPPVNQVNRLVGTYTIIPVGLPSDTFSFGLYSGINYHLDNRLILPSDTCYDESGNIILQNARFAGIVSDGPISFDIWSNDLITIYYRINGLQKHIEHNFPQSSIIDSLPASIY